MILIMYNTRMVQVFDEIKPPNDRTFGLFFATIFLSAAFVLNLFEFQEELVFVTVGMGLIFSIIAFFASHRLRHLNQAWFSVGLFLAKISNPLILGVVYLALITPVAILRRRFGQNPLRLNPSDEQTYWIDREKDTRQIDECYKSQY